MVFFFKEHFCTFFLSDFGNFTRLGKMDATGPWQLSFSDPATPIMEGIINFHNDLMFFIVAVTIFVLWMLIRCIMIFAAPTNDRDLGWKNQLGFLGFLTRQSSIRIKNSGLNNQSKQLLNSSQLYSEGINHHTPIEIAWTVTPALILMLIAVPSFALLYSIEEFIEPSLTVKCTGHQWYWCYEYSNCKDSALAGLYDGYKFESYMIPTDELEKGNLRLLEVDSRLCLPINTHVQVTVTAADVLHCWAVPALGIKIDACPGRLNQTSIFIKRPGVFFGQCSEICGVNHGFMPIVVCGQEFKEFAYSCIVSHVFNKLENGDVEVSLAASDETVRLMGNAMRLYPGIEESVIISYDPLVYVVPKQFEIALFRDYIVDDLLNDGVVEIEESRQIGSFLFSGE